MSLRNRMKPTDVVDLTSSPSSTVALKTTRKRIIKSEPKKSTPVPAKKRRVIKKKSAASEDCVLLSDSSIENVSESEDCRIVESSFALINCDTSSDEEDNENEQKNKSNKKKAVVKKEKTVVKKEITNDCSEFPMWDVATVLSENAGISRQVANNVVQLIEDDNTLPFIARYRKSMINFMSPELLQEVFETYDNVCKVRRKSISILRKLKSNNTLTDGMQQSIISARNIAELDLLYEPIKSRKSCADRIRSLGLESSVSSILNGNQVSLSDLCNSEMPTPDIVQTHIIHGLADAIYRDLDTLAMIRHLMTSSRANIMMICKKARATKAKVNTKAVSSSTYKRKSLENQNEKYNLYIDFKMKTSMIKPHQTLAINRGEAMKALSVKIEVDDWFYSEFNRFCVNKWKGKLVSEGAAEAYKKFILPWISRQVRTELTNIALKESVTIFCSNLKRLLLTTPVKGHNILAIDPGFKHGCKVAIIGKSGQPLETFVMYPKFNDEVDDEKNKLSHFVFKYRCEVLALGNGTACRETEKWIQSIKPLKEIPLIIVPEEGASIYSCSPEAAKEFPNMDPNIISAISLARRVLDPLSELVKVNVKHLGIGMYQHDVPVKLLNDALNNIITNCVSFVGVDLNTCSRTLLVKIAGLSEARVSNIMKHKEHFGEFKSREELLKVSGIGPKTYKQCAGFLRVLNSKNKFDGTWIHPESYELATKFVKKFNLNLEEIGTEKFIDDLKVKMATVNVNNICKELSCDSSDIDIIIEALRQSSQEDPLRNVKPTYSIIYNKIDQLKSGDTLTGIVRNVTSFGLFVDCGIGKNALLHNSKIGRSPTPQLGDKVLVEILEPFNLQKISIKLINIIVD